MTAQHLPSSATTTRPRRCGWCVWPDRAATAAPLARPVGLRYFECRIGAMQVQRAMLVTTFLVFLMAKGVTAAVVLDEDLNSYVAGDNPAGWLDTGPNNSLFEDDAFAVASIGSDTVFATASADANIHSHYVGPGADGWSSYEFTGRMRMSYANSGIGVTFYSDYPNSDTYYRLRRANFSGGTAFHITRHPDGTENFTGTANTGVVPAANVWYRFRIAVESGEDATTIRVKVWPDGSAEPAEWQVDCAEAGPSRLTAGTVGVWSYSVGEKAWDDLAVVIPHDCNSNGVDDQHDLVGGTSSDCNGNGVLDECDIAGGTSEDCDGNIVPDDCEIESGAATDCNLNDHLDECDLSAGTSSDCNMNTMPDECEVDNDCQGNQVPDDCEIAAGSSGDCDANDVPDECQLPSADCNMNGHVDACDILSGSSADCNSDGEPDECQLSDNDCNTNGHPDDCDIQHATSTDVNANGIPDDCERIEKGFVAVWGHNAENQHAVPKPNENFLRVAGGGYHSLGLKTDGSIVAWGRDAEGQCQVPSPNRGFVAIAAGYRHSLGLKSDGVIVGWGRPFENQLNVPPPNADFVAVAAGYEHSLGLKLDGSIVAWGHNYYGQCDVPSPNADFVAIAAGFRHSLGLKADGAIVAWGRNYDGQCDVPPPNRDFIAVAGGGDHSLALKADGSVVAWGDNGYGQSNAPSGVGFVEVDGGWQHSLALKADGTIIAWGRNDYGQCDVLEPNARFLAVSAGGQHSLAVAYRDCNENGISDLEDIAASTSVDCNANDVPDECDWAQGTSRDCNSNGLPDECELDGNDCNLNLIPDECDIQTGSSADCNGNDKPDSCDIVAATSGDCNSNGVPDECEPQDDCQPNGVQDICDIAGGTSSDCQSNGIPDECDLASGTDADCNTNGVADTCDIAAKSGSLTSTFAGGYGSRGAMFDLTVTNPLGITLTGFDFTFLSGPADAEVWCVADHTTYVGKDMAPTLWRLVGSASFPSVDSGTPVRVAIGGEHLNDGETVGFYCTRTDGGLLLTSVEPIGPFSNGDLIFEDRGLGKQYPFGTASGLRIWNGTVHYTSHDCNGNLILDDCELVENDCNVNGVPDECDIAGTTSTDCNANGVPDDCDFQNGRIYVDAAAAGDEDGTSWSNAVAELQSAMVIADCARGVVKEVWVAAGIYRPDFNVATGIHTGNRNASFRLRDGLAIYGGFAGGETALDQRNVQANETILSGDLAGDDVGNLPDAFRCLAGDGVAVVAQCAVYDLDADGDVDELDLNTDENAHRVVTADHVGATTMLSGFTVIGGNSPDGNGAGMYCDGGRPTIQDVKFSLNSSLVGGAVDVFSASPDLHDCVFDNNVAFSSGGALGIYLRSVSMYDCEFKQNRALGMGGGAVYQYGYTINFIRCRFTENECRSAEGEFDGQGGAVYSVHADSVFINSSFRDNAASEGGALCDSAGIPVFINCVLQENKAHRGGAIASRGTYGGPRGGYAESYPSLVNCVVYGNVADEGGGLFGDVLSHTMATNTVLWDNVDTSGINQASQITSVEPPVIDYSCIQGWDGSLGGIGNIASDPLFRNALGEDGIAGTADDDLRLGPGSPCIDAGSSGLVPEDEYDIDGDGDTAERVPLDLDGSPRFRDDPTVADTGVADPPAYPQVVDMGPYEFQFTDCNSNAIGDLADIAAGTSLDCNRTFVPDECEAIAGGDFDADGRVDLDDFAAFAACLAGPALAPNPPQAQCATVCLAAFDFNADGRVDLKDFGTYQALLRSP